jgi:hypothetical protein
VEISQMPVAIRYQEKKEVKDVETAVSISFTVTSI